MKCIVITICFILSCSAVFATDYKDSLLQVFTANYKKEKANGETFPVTLFKAYEESFIFDSDYVQRAFVDVGRFDSIGVESITKYVINRFVDEQLLEIESTGDNTSLIPIVEYLKNAACLCTADKMERESRSQNENPKEISAAFQECVIRVLSDSIMLSEVKALPSDVSSRALEYGVVYTFAHCNLLKKYLAMVCSTVAKSDFDNYIDKQHSVLIGSIRKFLLGEDDGKIQVYFQDRQMAEKMKSNLLSFAEKVKELHIDPYKLAATYDYRNQTVVYTYVNIGEHPSVICQVELVMEQANKITLSFASYKIIPGEKVKNAPEILQQFLSAPPPPTEEEIKRMHDH